MAHESPFTTVVSGSCSTVRRCCSCATAPRGHLDGQGRRCLDDGVPIAGAPPAAVWCRRVLSRDSRCKCQVRASPFSLTTAQALASSEVRLVLWCEAPPCAAESSRDIGPSGQAKSKRLARIPLFGRAEARYATVGPGILWAWPARSGDGLRDLRLRVCAHLAALPLSLGPEVLGPV